MKKPVCPHCKTEMKRVKYKGYYERFVYWQCECDDDAIPIDEDFDGAYA